MTIVIIVVRMADRSIVRRSPRLHDIPRDPLNGRAGWTTDPAVSWRIWKPVGDNDNNCTAVPASEWSRWMAIEGPAAPVTFADFFCWGRTVRLSPGEDSWVTITILALQQACRSATFVWHAVLYTQYDGCAETGMCGSDARSSSSGKDLREASTKILRTNSHYFVHHKMIFPITRIFTRRTATWRNNWNL